MSDEPTRDIGEQPDQPVAEAGGDLQRQGEWNEYLDLEEKTARETAEVMSENLPDRPDVRAQVDEVVHAQMNELPAGDPESGIPNEAEMMAADGFQI